MQLRVLSFEHFPFWFEPPLTQLSSNDHVGVFMHNMAQHHQPLLCYKLDKI